MVRASIPPKTVLAGLAVALVLGAGSVAPAPAQADLPARLSDQEFWSLSEALSEPNGYFRSENFLSNETWYQFVIPDLLRRTKPGGAYLGVGPEQNFAYIVALEPRIAIIFDIRRGNLQEHLLYKALFEMSADRAEFLSRLFCRPRPAGLGPKSTVEDLFAAYDPVAPAPELYRANLTAVSDWLTKKHGFKLRDEDLPGIDHVYQTAFYTGGPTLGYQVGRRGGGFGFGRGAPTYESLMMMDDGQGQQRGYLATEAHFLFLKALEEKNLVVPVVSDFGGPKGIRAVGRFLKAHGAVVTAFYLSNVEQYLYQDGKWPAFCANVAALPLDASSTFIRSVRGGGGGGRPGLMSELGVMATEVQICGGGRGARW